MKYLLKTYNDGLNEFVDPRNVDYLLFNLNKHGEELLKLKKRVEPLFKIDGFYCAEIFDQSVDPVSAESVIDIVSPNKDVEVEKFPPDTHIPVRDVKLDVMTVRLTTMGVKWVYCLKYDPVPFESAMILWSDIEETYKI